MAEMIMKYWKTDCGRGSEEYDDHDDPVCSVRGTCQEFVANPADVKMGIVNPDCIFHISKDVEICRQVKWYELDEYGMEYSAKANPKSSEMLFVDEERITFLSIDGRVVH